MKKTFRKIMAIVLAVMMLVSCMSIYSSASETENGNVWFGDEVEVDVVKGTEGYNYMSLFRKPVHGYEFSGHFIGEGEGPQTFVVIDTNEAGDTWTPNGVYEYGESNYDVVYCCDVETMIVDGTYYKRLNLEDSEYYDEEESKMIRAIVSNSYPYVSLEEMKAELTKNGYPHSDKLTRNEIIAAVQAAVWASANNMTAEDFRYAKSYRVTDNYQWGQPIHDTSDESGLDVTGTRKFETYPEVGERIDSLVDYLLALEGVEAPSEQIVITSLEIVKSVPAVENDGSFSTTLRVSLNSSGSNEKDSLKLDIYVDGALAKTEDVILGTSDYEVTVDSKVGQTIKAVVSGTQDLPRGVYFYAPRPADVDGDGIATSREVSQNLVGVSAGETEVYADAEVVVPNATELTVNKIWNDDGNRDGKRPESITVRLLADGAEVASKALGAENNWTWTFDGLPVYNNDNILINYTITEDPVEGYEAIIENYSVTNVHQSELTFIEVKKTWDDENDRDGIRPESITINLLANGKVVDTKTVTATDGWAWTFEDLHKYENGAEIVYSITEEAVEGYETVIDGFNVTNIHVPEEPETSEPETSEPETSEPETSEPETSEPETSEPETSEPETTEPETSEPETSEPETSEPETSEPETSEPETSEPETTEPEEEILDDPEVPLAPSVPEDTDEPEEEPETEDEFVEIEDPEVPLAPEAPQTGSNALFVWLVVAAASGTLFTFDVFRRRRAAADR